MTTLGKLFRTTAFKLAIAYSVIFALAAALIIGNVGRQVKAAVDEQIVETVEADIRGLVDQYSQGGVAQIVDSIERRIGQPGGDIYLLTTFNGEAIVGNVADLPVNLIDEKAIVETLYRRPGEQRARHRALARVFILPGGFKLLVGHDIEERETLTHVLRRVLFVSLAWLVFVGALGGVFVARRVLMRVDAISASANKIMEGDLSRRLPVSGAGDELDRLAENLNAMIARIETLVKGLAEVSDNIAHDLRTPLTRLRNQADIALRAQSQNVPIESSMRATLEKIIEESDSLIKIFDALLMIARAESGSGPQLSLFDAAPVLLDIAELYEAAAEECGARFTTDIQPDLFIQGNRELIAQALANLLDNAFKYGVQSDGSPSNFCLAAHRDDRCVRFIVSDDGPGIAEQDRERVIERFVRLEKARSKGGSGLGLSMVAAIAKLHGGKFWLEGAEKGLRAVFELPAVVEDKPSH